MRSVTGCFRCAILAVGAILAAAVAARAETWTLELKRVESERSGVFSGSMIDYLCRATEPQSFFVQFGPDGKPLGIPQGDGQTTAFEKLVKKEPKYESEHPFRGVMKLGTEEYAFALDMVSPEPAATESKDAKTQEATKAEEKKPNADSPLAKLRDQLLKSAESAPKLIAYNRLYFDFNHNGDLTDDKVIEAKTPPQTQFFEQTTGESGGVSKVAYARFEFPQIDVTIDAGGTKVDSSIRLSGNAQSSQSFSYVSIQANAGAYREGEITLEGKKHHVILVDFNSNGRFDDATTVSDRRMGPDKRIYPQYGDVLLVDPETGTLGMGSPYDWSTNDCQQPVAKLVNIDGRYYDMTVSPAGDKLTLTASTVATGNVTNPNDGFRALVYSDKGLLKISGDKDVPIALPEGEWKLLSYTIHQTEQKKPAAGTQQAKEQSEKKELSKKDSSLILALSGALDGLLGTHSGPSTVSAHATADYKSITVRKGETVVMPFGPPYTPTVTGDYFQDGKDGKQLSLAMSLVGSTGEVCSDLTANGRRPDKPAFTITDDQGKEVESGNFEYG